MFSSIRKLLSLFDEEIKLRIALFLMFLNPRINISFALFKSKLSISFDCSVIKFILLLTLSISIKEMSFCDLESDRDILMLSKPIEYELSEKLNIKDKLLNSKFDCSFNI